MKRSLIVLPGSALVLGLLAGVPAQAAPAPAVEAAADSIAVTNASMTWAISACAFDVELRSCTSLTERQATLGDVDRGESGWVFTGGDGTVDASTGEMVVSWTADVQIGNTNRGNYSITFSDPVLSVRADGSGSLAADVTWQIATDTPVTTEDVTVVTFADANTDADFSAIPTAFDPTFIAALNPQMQPWFIPTGSSYDADKVPSAVAVDRWVPTLVVELPKKFESKNPRVKNKRFMVTVTGTGFDPAEKANPAVQGLYVVFGPNAGATEGGYQDMGMYFRARYLVTAPDAAGEFTTKLQVRGAYTKDGVSYNGRFGEALGVSTWAAHSHATTAWDAFERIRFRK